MATRDTRRSRSWVGPALQVLVWLLFIALLVPAGGVGYVLGKNSEEDAAQTKTVTVSQAQALRAERASIEAAPAFTADALTSEPRDGWITNGGTLANQRYSPLDQIDT